MISRAPGLKLVVETLITSLRPIGNIVLICCAFFIIFGILGVQVRGGGRGESRRRMREGERRWWRMRGEAEERRVDVYKREEEEVRR